MVSAQYDQSSLYTQWFAKELRFLRVDNENYPTGQTPQLIWVHLVQCHFIDLLAAHICSHYENTPIQIYTENFTIKN